MRVPLVASCEGMTHGKMPGTCTLPHPELRLSAQDVETICAAARQTEAKAPTDVDPNDSHRAGVGSLPHAAPVSRSVDLATRRPEMMEE